MKRLDINADMGESYGHFKIGQDEALMPLLTSCNVACGFHGGDPLTIKRTILLALENEVAVGAHPSYPDLVGFGRRKMHLSQEELSAALLYQVSAIKGMVESFGGQLHHVKPHGALNNHMMEDPEVLNCVLDTLFEFDPHLPVYVPYSPKVQKKTYNVLYEIFADRSYEQDFSLTKRSVAGSLLSSKKQFEPHLKHILEKEEILVRQGGSQPIEIDTLCIHGDNPGAFEIAQHVSRMAANLEIEIKTVDASTSN